MGLARRLELALPFQVTVVEHCPAACSEAAASSGVSLRPGSVCSLTKNISRTGTRAGHDNTVLRIRLLETERQLTFTFSLSLPR